MSSALYPPLRPQSLGEVLDTVFRIFRASLLRCLPHGILSIIAGQLPALYSLAMGRPPGFPRSFDPLWMFFYVLGALGAILLWGAVVVRQHAIGRGLPTSARDELTVALKALPALVTLTLLLMVVSAVAIRALLAVTPSDEFLLLLLVPGLPVLVVFSLCFPAVLLTGRGPFVALGYSVRLVSGNLLRTLTVFVVTIAVFVVFYIVASVLVALIMPLLGVSDVPVVMSVLTVVLLALGAAATPFFCALMLATFADLQLRKEGTDLERRISNITSD